MKGTRRAPSRGLPLPLVLVLATSAFFFGLYYDQLPFLGDPAEDLIPTLAQSGGGADTAQGSSHPVFAVPGDASSPFPTPGASGGSATGGGAGAHVENPIAVDKELPDPSAEKGVEGNSYFSEIPFQILSWHPRAVLFPNFASDETCDKIVGSANPRLAPSGLALRKGDTTAGTRDVRTSQGTFMSRHDDRSGALAWVEDKMAQATMVHAKHGEPFNILRYDLGQKYDSHYDTFDPASYGPQSSQRIASFLLYLTDVEEGGETIFPLEGPDGLQRLKSINYKSCDMGLKVKPKKGDALLFYSIHPNGTFDKHALHGGCPVQKGQKWVATKWIRDKCFGRC